MGSSRDGHWLEKEDRNSRSLFNLLGLFGAPAKQAAAARLAEWLIMARLQANDINRPKRHCRIGKVIFKDHK